MLYLLNTNEIGGYTYTPRDMRGIKPLSEYGLSESFYGGRVKKIGLTESDLLLLVDENMNIIDLGTTNLETLPIDGLKRLCDLKHFKYHHKTGRPKLIALIEGREVEDD